MNIDVKKLAKTFKTLADENRLKILLFIYNKNCKCDESTLSCRNETCIKDLAKFLNITIPTISHHIKELVNAGLITTKKEGRWVYCKINQKIFKKTGIFLNRLSLNRDQDYENNSERK